MGLAGCAHTGLAATIAASVARANLFMAPRLPTPRAYSIHGLRLRKFPLAAQNLIARAIEPHHVVPSLRGGNAIRGFAVAAAELYRNCAVSILFRSDAVQGIAIVLILLQTAFGVINDHRPECVDRHLGRHIELVDR